MFDVTERDGLGRIGRLTLGKRTLETPALLPVINPNKILVPPKEMAERFGCQAFITNSYIIRRTPELRERALAEGLHGLLDFEGPIMTDSGTFQAHVYGRVDVTNRDIVEFQRDIGSDIGTILDIFSEPGDDKQMAMNAVGENLARGREACGLKGEMALAGPIQGGVYRDLRESCAYEMSKLDFEIHPVGGIVPLMESYRFTDLVHAVASAKRGLTLARPVHAFGAGHPMVFPLLALLGCDMFDSASYAKFSADGRMLFPDGTRDLAGMKEFPCECPMCSTHTPSEVEKSENKVRLLAEHNLHVSFGELRRVREAIREGRLWELAENRARAHPQLLDALRALPEHADFMERHEPISRPGAFFHLGPESRLRPAVKRFETRVFERWHPGDAKAMALLPERGKPYSRDWARMIEGIVQCSGAEIGVEGYFGTVPIGLDEVYPIAQSMVPEMLDGESRERARGSSKGFRERFGGALEFVVCDMECKLEALARIDPRRDRNLDIERVAAVADYQFGKGAGAALTDGKVRLVTSKNTGKIRNVYLDERHVLSMRAEDGMFTLKLEGAHILFGATDAPRLRVAVHQDAAEFVVQGKSAFAGFILACDPGLRPGDECIVVTEKDEFLAAGQLVMAPDEMLDFKKGMAVKVREGLGQAARTKP
ncbi:MAG: tRNA guanosine(15) transglycosylase TgtA [Methanobacteriota archaeon]